VATVDTGALAPIATSADAQARRRRSCPTSTACSPSRTSCPERAHPRRAGRIGFKRRALVPDQAGGRIGKGGEVYIEVDASTRQAQRGKGGD
jgi:hypothetical protein